MIHHISSDRDDDFADHKILNLDHCSTAEMNKLLLGQDADIDDKSQQDTEDIEDQGLSQEGYKKKRADENRCRGVGSYVSQKNEIGRIYESKVDLHHLSVAESIQLLEHTIDPLLKTYSRVCLQIITGRGRHSGADGPQIAPQAYQFISTHYRDQIIKIQDCPTTSMINNVAIRGYFTVELKGYRS